MSNNIPNEIQKNRRSEYPIHPLILSRWSSRAMSGEEMTDSEIRTLFEAARWAPSASNNQPWRFLYAKRNSQYWEVFFNLLTEGNQVWAKNAAVLVVIISATISDYKSKPIPTHSFDTGAAWENLALEASHHGFIAHGMAGFDYEKARARLRIPKDYVVEAMIAVGKKGKKIDLPDKLQEREVPSDRRPLNEIIKEGKFQP